jgi:hypothetical protein
MWVLAIFVSASVSAVISGIIIENYGWKMTFKISISLSIYSKTGTVLLGVETLLIFFFCPETTYRRSDDLNIDLGTANKIKHSDEVNSKKEMPERESEAPLTLFQRLRPWRGIESEENLFKIIIRPLPLLLFPQVMYSFITGLSNAWISVLAGIFSLIFGSPPYNFSVEQIGLIGIGALIASLLGFIAGPLSDRLCKFMARRNNGIYEPEVPPFFWKKLTIVSSRKYGFHIFLLWNRISRVRYFVTARTAGYGPNFIYMLHCIRAYIYQCCHVRICRRLPP